MNTEQKNNIKIISLFSIALLVMTFNYSLAKDIISTKEGGDWCKNTTWIGGDIPGSNDNVFIEGKVIVNCPAFADSVYINLDCILEINSTDSLQCHYIKMDEQGDRKGAIRNYGIINVWQKPEIKKEDEY